MSILVVTGGAGFIGSNFVRAALGRTSARVVVFDKLTYAGSLENLRDLESDDRYEFVCGDIASREDVDRLFREVAPRALVNFAAESHVDRSIDGPEAFLETNVRGTFQLLESSRRFLAVQPALAEHFRFLQVSTDEVFGSLGATGSFRETTAYAPNSPYAASKAAADHFVRAYHHTYGVPTLLTNCSNNYGPLQFPEKLIPLMTLNAVEGKELPIYGDGSNVRDWLHVEDHCQGLLDVLEKASPGSSYCFGGGAELSNVEIVDRICEAVEAELPAAQSSALREQGVSSYRDLRKFVPDRPGHDQRYSIDSSLAAKDLGWRPRRSFETGLRETVAWYLQHRDWCEAVHDEKSRERLGLGTEADARGQKDPAAGNE